MTAPTVNQQYTPRYWFSGPLVPPRKGPRRLKHTSNHARRNHVPGRTKDSTTDHATNGARIANVTFSDDGLKRTTHV